MVEKIKNFLLKFITGGGYFLLDNTVNIEDMK